ncbi:hypothetical protein [Phenylobacterium immobile]|uniref:hypothetical protein n=1 Tax=Phenylobacterium immobile TaxID=21 RepID=UPI000AC5730E|nr:hypothetical protein [Phenylobacterium immobile]
MRLGLTFLLFGALSLTACSQPAPTQAPETAPPTPAPTTPRPPPPPRPTATVGGDGSSIELSALTGADIHDNRLDGELACSFSTPTASPLVIARGDVGSQDAAFGLIKVAGYVERMAAPGGFDGMLPGAVFTGQGKTVTVALTGPATEGGESPPRPAILTYDRADGAKRIFPGLWTCGP